VVQCGVRARWIITALLTLWADPTIAKGVLRFLAPSRRPASNRERCRAGQNSPRDAQGRDARLGEVPFARYYGSVDATPLFVMLAGEYFARTGDLDTIGELWPHIKAALQWIDTYAIRS